MKPVGFVVFDFDGVIADTRKLAAHHANLIAVEYFPMLPQVNSQEGFAQLFSGPLKTSLRRFGLSDEQAGDFFDRHSAAMRTSVEEIRLFPEVVQCLSSLPNTKRAIVTSAYADAVRSILKKQLADSDCDQIDIYGRELMMKKSDKFQLIVEKYGIEKRALVKVGDMVSDILYAREFGIQVGVTSWGYHPLSYLEVFQPDFTFANFDELRIFVDRIK
jgi:phosphoglycolate phosphatase